MDDTEVNLWSGPGAQVYQKLGPLLNREKLTERIKCADDEPIVLFFLESWSTQGIFVWQVYERKWFHLSLDNHFGGGNSFSDIDLKMS
eukprot:CAMPEP_0184688342 /NCGR_PEP_ID=MMETSP0312-20130426/29524_1 /TAXON_ID=31354 /ORGANISM="Compsopogon coeruleus, Strain SAG 36.94" /LENGTH=87 /DNA_ID=CAMNT_0027145391 /DNA_START=392 /DNA_END=655 /DNA_ORIENTATION=+